MYEDGDSDALYVVGGTVNLTACVFSDAKDDCIDSGSGPGGELLIDACLVDGCFHEGIALSDSANADSTTQDKSVIISRTLVTNAQQGIELGFSTSALRAHISSSLVAGNPVGSVQ